MLTQPSLTAFDSKCPGARQFVYRMGAAESIVLGVISGILTAAALYVIALIFKRLVIPWYIDLVYKGVKIHGTWGYYPRPFNPAWPVSGIVFQLEQHANRIIGNAIFPATQGSPKAARRFNLTGQLTDRFFVAALQHSESGKMGISTLLVEVVSDGDVMDGVFTHYNVQDRTITPVQCTLRRNHVPQPQQPSSAVSTPPRPPIGPP